MLKSPVKIYGSGSHLNTVSNDIVNSKWDHTALGLAEIHDNRLNDNKLHLE